MLHLRRRFVGLCLLPILLCGLDTALTLSQQPPEYWAGDYARASEGNRWYYRLMSHHPLTFLAWEAASLAVLSGIILLSPQTVALTISIAVTLGYTVGSSTWLLYGRFRYGHELFIGLCLLTAFAMALGIRWGWLAEPRSDAPAGARWPWAVRWAVILALAGIAAYMHLWPHDPG